MPIITAGCPHLLWKRASGCLYLREYRHRGAYFYVKLGIRDAYFWGCLYSLDTGKKLALRFIAPVLVIGHRPSTSTSRPPDVIQVIGTRCSQAFPVFRAFPLPCIILNANYRRKKNGVGLGTRLPTMHIPIMFGEHWCASWCWCSSTRHNLYITLPGLFFTLRDSTILYLGSTSL